MKYTSQKRWLYNHRGILLLIFAGLVTVALFSHAPIPQLPHYNCFADQSAWYGLPHAQNTLSNLPFLFVGIWGLWRLRRYSVVSKFERLAWAGFFLGGILTCFGSAYYHLQPDNLRLVWDRIPIIFSFLCLFTAVIAERVSIRFATISFLPMLIYGIGAVVYWYFTETSGQGDMRAYILVQLLPLLLIPLLLRCYAARYTQGWMLLCVAAWYLLSKVFEAYDQVFYQLSGGIVGGHAIKHLLAAMATAQVVWMLERRKCIPVPLRT